MPFYTQAMRVVAIFQSTLFITIGHGMLMVSLPLALQADSISTSGIGGVMAGFSLGLLLGSLFSQRIFARLGYYRAFVLMLSLTLICVAIHGVTGNVIVTFLLRVLFGIGLISIFIMIESWLNGLSDALNRGKVFSIYQIFFGVGYAISPVLYQFGSRFDYSVYFIIVIIMAIGVFPLTISRLPAPELPEEIERKSIMSVWRLSPEIFTTVFFAGFIFTATVSLTALYAVGRFQDGWFLTLILSSYAIGSLIMQFPVGWLADRYKKTLISLVLMLLGVLANTAIYFSHQMQFSDAIILTAFLIAGGAAACMYPLSITHIYDHIDNENSISWIASIQLIYGVGSLIGPVTLGFAMDAGGLVMFPVSLLAAHLLVSLVVLFMSRRAKHEEDTTPNYQVGMQQATLATHPVGSHIVSGGEDTSLISDPILKVLIAALKQNIQAPEKLLRLMLEDGMYSAGDLAVNIVYYCGDQAKELLDCLLEIAPDMRINITLNLLERLVDEEGRLTMFITRALLNNASDQERQEIRELITTHQTTVIEQMA